MAGDKARCSKDDGAFREDEGMLFGLSRSFFFRFSLSAAHRTGTGVCLCSLSGPLLQ